MNKYKKGYTTGVFDLFHVGHLNVLKNSKSYCDQLVVGITTDELVLKRKNKIPFIPFYERVDIVSSCRYVDLVIPQNDMDKLLIVKELGCDVVFVGDDWKGHPSWIEYEEEFNKIGVDVIYLEYTAYTSSTKLQEIINDAIKQKNKASLCY